ncbi:MAG: PAS domain-containing sensor histidine kinase [Fulvivirga sp.]|nr:PAS domain-containing sensor histidine kinase [Fulvivirga sp.]
MSKKEVERLQNEVDQLKQILEKEPRLSAEQTFQNIFDNSTELIYIHTPEGVFIDVNNAVIEKYGYAKEEIIGNTPALFSAPDMNDLEDVARKTKIVWGGGSPQSLEWYSQKKDGTIFIKELVIRKGVYFGQDVIIATGRDITKRKETENKLRETNRELKSLNEALDAFVYSASHDLKAPLSSVKGLINLLRADHDADPSSYLDKMDTSIDKLIGFVNDLVEYSRNARTDVKNQRVDVKQLLDHIWRDLEYMPENENIEKIIEIQDNIQLRTDEYRLRIILNNLLSNAVRYRNPSIQDAYVKTIIAAENDHAKIIIEDNGIGIDSSHKEDIFNMFYRATDLKTGSGLGLYIVKETVNKLGGKVVYDSTLGEGTTFTVTIPNKKST